MEKGRVGVVVIYLEFMYKIEGKGLGHDYIEFI